MATKSVNLWSKSRPKENPYLTIKNGSWTYFVLKAYQTRAKERTNPYARWFCAVSSPYTFGGYDMGDTYIKDIPVDAIAAEILDQRCDAEQVKAGTL